MILKTSVVLECIKCEIVLPRDLKVTFQQNLPATPSTINASQK